MEYLFANVFVFSKFAYGIIIDVDYDDYEQMYCIQYDDGSTTWLYSNQFNLID